MRRILGIAVLMLTVACYRPMNDPDVVARAFADALMNGNGSSALIYTAPSYREKDGLAGSLAFDSSLLEACRGKILRNELPENTPDRRTYRFFFTEICGTDIQLIGLDVSLAKNGDRWQVVNHAPQLLPPRS